MNVLEACEIVVNYGTRTVIDRASLQLASGEVIALLGANGAGKSTLVRALNGTLPLTSGSVSIGGRDITDMTRREVARSIAVVAQENETRFPVTVLEFVLSGRFVHGNALGWETRTDIDLAHSALAECGLTDFSSRLMNHLSGGERQRVVLARALAAGTSTLLLDEPTANLDLAHQAMMFRLVRDRCNGCGASAIVITHDLNLAASFADTVIMLKDGRIKASGTPDEVLTADMIREVFGVDVLLDKNPMTQKARVTTIFN